MKASGLIIKFKLFMFMTIFMTGIFLTIGCERQPPNDYGFDCEYCYQIKPDSGQIGIKVTINDENPYVPITIYIGNIEDNNIEYSDTSYSSEYWVDVPVDKYYSVTAEYKSGDNTIIAVDGDKFKLKKNTKDCDEECYYYSGGFFDNRLLK